MKLYPQISTLPLLGLFMFTALALNDDAVFFSVGSFKLSPFDILFVAMVAAKLLRLADPQSYALPRGSVGMVQACTAVAVVYLCAKSMHHPGIETGDVARDLRIVFYFLMVPALCYKDIDSAAAYATLQRFIVAAGIAVATLMLAEQLRGFSTVDPLRNVRLGVWVIPLSVVSLLYFRKTLKVSNLQAYLLVLYMLLALTFSLNRSQYLQLFLSVGLAVMLGTYVGALRKAMLIFVPAFVAGVVVFHMLGYLDILLDRIFTVQDLESDSSYGARVQEMEGQMEFFRQAPYFGKGAGFRSWVMGEFGFELSTFAHNSWAFYLMKFGIVGTTIIMLAPLLILTLSLLRRYAHPGLELHRRYLVSCVPVYIFIDSMSGGLAYAPKTAFTGFLLCYCLSLMRNARAMPVPQPVTTRAPAALTPITWRKAVHHG